MFAPGANEVAQQYYAWGINGPVQHLGVQVQALEELGLLLVCSWTVLAGWLFLS